VRTLSWIELNYLAIGTVLEAIHNAPADYPI
jgi:hypothetical protein